MFKNTLKTVVPGQLDWLRSDLDVLAQRAGMVSPRLFLSPDEQPNAFATGRNERNAVVCGSTAMAVAQ